MFCGVFSSVLLLLDGPRHRRPSGGPVPEEGAPRVVRVQEHLYGNKGLKAASSRADSSTRVDGRP